MTFTRAIGWLAIVNGIAQFVQLAAQPFLSQIYAPDQFGLLAQLVVISSIIGIFGTLQIHNYLVLSKSEDEMRRLVSVAVTLTNVVCVITYPLLLLLSTRIFGYVVSDELVGLVCLLLMTQCYGSVQRGIQTATGDFKGMMRYVTVRSVVLIAAQLLFGLRGVEYGLIYGLLLGEIGGLLSVSTKTLSLVRNISISEITSNAKVVFRAQTDFILSGSLQELVALAVFMLPLYLISRLYGNVDGGQFAMAHKMAWAPILLLSQSISPAFMKYASSLDSDALRKMVFLNPVASFSVFVVMSGLSILFVKVLFLAIFDDIWRVSADISVWLFVLAAAYFCSLPYRLCCRIMNRQRIQLYVDTVSLVLLVILFSNYRSLSLMMLVQAVVVIGVIQNIFVSIIAKNALRYYSSDVRQ